MPMPHSEPGAPLGGGDMSNGHRGSMPAAPDSSAPRG